MPTPSFRVAPLVTMAALAFAAGCSCSSDPILGPPKNDGGPRTDSGNGRDTGTGNQDGSQDGDTGDGSNICEQIHITAERNIPNVLIVLDRSLSMADDNRWTQAKPAVKNVVTNLENNIAFGLMLFPVEGGDSCGTGSVVVSPAVGTAVAIGNELEDTDPGGYTPSAASLDNARNALASLDGASYVLFVTDGAPNCNSSLNKNSCTCTYGNAGCSGLTNSLCLDQTRTVTAVANLAAASIPTYVIGFDASDWSTTLNAMAAAGGTARSTYIPVSDGTTLEAELADLAGQVTSCTYELESAPADYHYVSVTLDGTPVLHTSQTQDGSGWSLSGKTVELLGSTCDALQESEDGDLKITVECSAVVPF